MFYFFHPLFLYVLERVWTIKGEAHEKDIRLWVGEGPNAII